MDDRKQSAKDRNTKPPGATATSKSDPSGSFTERLSTSASGLARDAFLRHGRAGTVQALATLAANNEKGESSSSSAGSSESPRTIESCSLHPPPAGSASMPAITGTLGESFRSDSTLHKYPLDAAAIDNFGAFLSSRDPPLFHAVTENAENKERYPGLLIPRSGDDQEYHHSFKDGRQSFSEPDAPQAFSKTQRRLDSTSPAATQSPSYSYDGAAVVALLSNPGFTMDDEPLNGTHEAAPWNSRPQESKHEGMKFEKSTGGQLKMGHRERALIPDFALTNLDSKAAADAIPYDEEQDRIEDLKPWLDILDSYQDEVWGDFLPLVQQAREEIKEAKDGDQSLDDKPAIRRLRMLLGHLDPIGDRESFRRPSMIR